jgi:hypothetical protein
VARKEAREEAELPVHPVTRFVAGLVPAGFTRVNVQLSAPNAGSDT